MSIFHIASAADWEAAQAAGEYRVSTPGRSLEAVGYVHCCGPGQVAGVAERWFRGASGLVLLTVDPARVAAEIRYEVPDGGAEAFPHVYGPIPVDAVTRVEGLDLPAG